jgi:hypothetical protein
MTDSSTSVYAHSGKLGMGFFVVPLGGAVGAILLSIIYAYITVCSPIAGYISLLFVGGLAFGLAFLISRLERVAKCRKPAFLNLGGLVCGLLALYTSWVTFECALLARSDGGIDATMLEIFMSPAAVWGHALAINENGWYSMFGGTPSGIVLWLIWGIEAIIIVVGPTILATMGLEDEVFCESCNRWCGQTLDAVRLAPPEGEDDLKELRPDNLGPLQALQPAEQDVYPFLRIDMWHCDSCNQTAALQAKFCAVEADGDGDPKQKAENLTQIWLVEPAALVEVTSIGGGGGAGEAEGVEQA